MSDMHPIAAPARARSEPAPARRNTSADAAQRFADSLATARDMAREARSQAPDVKGRKAESRNTRDDDATTPLRTRAQVQALMLSGAMKFARTRDADCDGAGAHAVQLPMAGVMSLPAVPGAEDDHAATIALNGEVDAGGVMSLRGNGNADAPWALQLPDTDRLMSAPAMMDGKGSDVAGLDVVVQSLPDAPANNSKRVQQAPATLVDLSASNAAAAAAMQLVAQLPIAPDVIANAPATIDDAADATEAHTATAGVDSRATTQDDAAPMLVEDHFDAPAELLETVILSSGPVRVPVAASTTASGAAGTAAASTPASSIATTKALGASAIRTDGSTVQKDLAKLSPEFRDRLQRVMDRMHREHGHDVTVVETVRSQARQDALYAQGRTTPGNVVTWTKSSKHGQGQAADVIVDGLWQNPAGYAHLADIAKQEGLRTLGSRDPGHVELPTEGSVSGETLGNLLSDLQGEAGDAARRLRADVQAGGRESNAEAIARVANVAQVARVATVATVAKVAGVSRPGAASRDAASNGSESISPLAVSGPMPTAGAQDLGGALRVAAPTSSLQMADRIAHLMDLQATQATKPLSSVLLRMENANGIEDQLRIDTRGTSVDARLGLGNAQQAAALTDRVGELREALERRGLTADGVRVQATSASRASDSVSFSRAALPTMELAAMRAAADSQAQGNTRDQSSRDAQQREAFAREQDRHTPRSSPDDTRNRSRREQPEDRR